MPSRVRWWPDKTKEYVERHRDEWGRQHAAGIRMALRRYQVRDREEWTTHARYLGAGRGETCPGPRVRGHVGGRDRGSRLANLGAENTVVLPTSAPRVSARPRRTCRRTPALVVDRRDAASSAVADEGAANRHLGCVPRRVPSSRRGRDRVQRASSNRGTPAPRVRCDVGGRTPRGAYLGQGPSRRKVPERSRSRGTCTPPWSR